MAATSPNEATIKEYPQADITPAAMPDVPSDEQSPSASDAPKASISINSRADEGAATAAQRGRMARVRYSCQQLRNGKVTTLIFFTQCCTTVCLVMCYARSLYLSPAQGSPADIRVSNYSFAAFSFSIIGSFYLVLYELQTRFFLRLIGRKLIPVLISFVVWVMILASASAESKQNYFFAKCAPDVPCRSDFRSLYRQNIVVIVFEWVCFILWSLLLVIEGTRCFSGTVGVRRNQKSDTARDKVCFKCPTCETVTTYDLRNARTDQP